MNKKESICRFLVKFADKINFKTMNKRLLPLAVLFSTIWLLTSCLKNDDADMDYPHDTAITAFSLGTLNRYQTTLSSKGVDSTYRTTVEGKQYGFSIDQNNALIFNADSLPYGVDAKKVVCNITSKNSGVILIKSMTSDSLRLYAATDSVDFSVPRVIRVYSSSQEQFRDYTIRLNVHQEKADEMKWNLVGTQSQLANLTAMKAVTVTRQLYVFGLENGQTTVYSAASSAAAQWQKLTPNVVLDANAYKNVAVFQGKLYLLNGTTVLSSADGKTWNSVAAVNANMQSLVAVSGLGVHLLGADAKIYLLKHGETQLAPEALDAAGSYLPTDNWNAVVLKAESGTKENVLLIGNRSVGAYAGDAHAVVWNRLIFDAANALAEPWSYYAAEGQYALPRLVNLQVVGYDGGLLALGGVGLGTAKQKAFEHFYYSGDGGLTWQNNAVYQLPKAFNSSDTAFAMTVDADNNIWMVCGGTGQVWKGRKNSAGWQKTDTVFTSSSSSGN